MLIRESTIIGVALLPLRQEKWLGGEAKKNPRFGVGLNIFSKCSIRPKILLVIEYFVFDIISFQQSQDTLVIAGIELLDKPVLRVIH